MNIFQKIAPVFAMAALGLVAAPEIANAQNYPGAVYQSGQYQNYGYQREYIGPPMTMEAAQEVKAHGPDRDNILPFAGVGYAEARFPDGEHIGVRFQLHDSGFATVAQTYDLNKTSDIISWDSNRNNMAGLDDINGQRYAGAYSGPTIFRPCIQRGGAFEVIIGRGMAGVIFGGPYFGNRHYGGHGGVIGGPVYDGRHQGGGAVVIAPGRRQGGEIIVSAPIGNRGGIVVALPIGGDDHRNRGGGQHGGNDEHRHRHP